MARVGLVLGAGGPVGHAYHVGTLAALAEAGWDARQATVIVGTSIGAITGALLAGGVSPADLNAQVMGRPPSPEGSQLLAGTDTWSQLISPCSPAAHFPHPASWSLLGALITHPWRARAGLVLAALRPTGTAPTAPVAAIINRLHLDDGSSGAEKRRPALWVCAVDMDNGRRAVFGAGHGPDSVRTPDTGTAVAASSAVPSVFAPVVIGGRRYVDGGLHSPVNGDVIAAAVVALDLDVVVVSAPMAIGEWPGRFGVDIPGRYGNHRKAVRELRPVGHLGCPIALFEPGRGALSVMHFNAFDLGHGPDIATAAMAAAAARTKRALAGRDSPLALALSR